MGDPCRMYYQMRWFVGRVLGRTEAANAWLVEKAGSRVFYYSDRECVQSQCHLLSYVYALLLLLLPVQKGKAAVREAADVRPKERTRLALAVTVMERLFYRLACSYATDQRTDCALVL
jgi:hypothetical protein